MTDPRYTLTPIVTKDQAAAAGRLADAAHGSVFPTEDIALSLCPDKWPPRLSFLRYYSIIGGTEGLIGQCGNWGKTPGGLDPGLTFG